MGRVCHVSPAGGVLWQGWSPRHAALIGRANRPLKRVSCGAMSTHAHLACARPSPRAAGIEHQVDRVRGGCCRPRLLVMRMAAIPVARELVRAARVAVAGTRRRVCRASSTGLHGIPAPPPPAAAAPAMRSMSPLHEGKLMAWSELGRAGEQLLELVSSSTRLCIVTGAGISTASGLSDYRSPGRPPYRPLQHAEFVRNESTRRRYWSRSFVGFPRMQNVTPNAGHRAIAALERSGRVGHIITQNVDRLHQRGGAVRVLELHGTIHDVECMACGATLPRAEVQAMMERDNRRWLDHFTSLASLRPDGDVELPPESYVSFCVPRCPACRGETLKPMVVFHGGSIPPHVTAASLSIVKDCDAMLVVGSTCTTWSSFRLVRQVATTPTGASPPVTLQVGGVATSPVPPGPWAGGRPVGVINFGPTRGDEYARVKVEHHISDVLTALIRELGLQHTAA